MYKFTPFAEFCIERNFIYIQRSTKEPPLRGGSFVQSLVKLNNQKPPQYSSGGCCSDC